MFCSTVIPTIGRSTLSRAVHSVLDQAFTADDFEVIVVNDSGQPLPEADWQRSGRVQVIHTHRRERCVARNAGAAVAKGRYLHFLDDDDWLLPGALKSLWELAHHASGAVWLYGGSQLVDRAGEPLIQLHHRMNGNCFVQAMAGEWMPLQASLIEANTFFAVGRFASLIPGEDVDLCRRVALVGDMAGTSALVACIAMGVEGSSTDYTRGPEHSRRAREKILNEPGVLARMRASARSGFWHGRITRTYLTSALWNLQHRNLLAATSRVLSGLVSLVLAGHHIVSSGFWCAVMRSYESETFLRGFREANRPVQRRDVRGRGQ